MPSLPYPLFPLVCASIFFATLLLALSAVVVVVSPALWVVPAAFILTLGLHAVFILLSNSEKDSVASLRLFSATVVFSYFCAAAIWVGAMAVLVFYTVELYLNKMPSAQHGREWVMITASALSLLQTALLLTIAVHSYKIRQKLRYAAKWQWKPSATVTQWR